MSKLSHLDQAGAANMVDVSAKPETVRVARAEGRVLMSAEAYRALIAGDAKKGDVLGTARLAGIMAAKRTAELIPLCHALPLAKVTIDFAPDEADHSVAITAEAKTVAQTGVEMEALTAVSVAALTLYDMLKAVDKSMRIDGIRLLEKTGGKSGRYKASAAGGRKGKRP
jgi:cyclic pyranopterin phosphate synthase